MDFGDSDDSSLYLIHGLIWFNTPLFGENLGTQRRRPEFPSWSWAGWAGVVYYPYHPRNLKSHIRSLRFRPVLGLDIVVRQANKTEWVARPSLSSPRLMCLQARTIPPAAFSYDESMRQWRVHGIAAWLEMSQGIASPSKLAKELINREKW